MGLGFGACHLSRGWELFTASLVVCILCIEHINVLSHWLPGSSQGGNKKQEGHDRQ